MPDLEKIYKKIDIKNSDFIKYMYAISDSSFYSEHKPELGKQHKIGHIQKVMFLSYLIAIGEEINEDDMKLLLVSAAFHDCGRKKDRNDKEHGINGAKKVKEYFEKNINNPYNIKQNEIGIIQAIIEYHTVSEKNPGQIDYEILKEMCNKYGVNENDSERTIKISAILKDADALDRFRFSTRSSLDKKKLRTKTAKNSVLSDISKRINQEYAKEVLDRNYYNEQNGLNDKVSELQNIRNTYKKMNNGIYKDEIDISLKKMIEIFENALIYNKDKIEISSNYEIKKVSIGNTGDMYYVLDKDNNKEYYFKPAISKNGTQSKYRAYIQESAYKIQRIINPQNAVKCNTIKLNDMFGAIQEKIDIDVEETKSLNNYFKYNNGSLSEDILKQLFNEYLVDFCICNYDSTFRNFIIDKNGRLRGIDKEQSFRYVKDDSTQDMLFSKNYNEKYGASPSVYNTLFIKMINKEISTKYLEIVKNNAKRIFEFPDEEYKSIFREYAYAKEKDLENAEMLLSIILERKKNILRNTMNLFEYINDRLNKREEVIR